MYRLQINWGLKKTTTNIVTYIMRRKWTWRLYTYTISDIMNSLKMLQTFAIFGLHCNSDVIDTINCKPQYGTIWGKIKRKWRKGTQTQEEINGLKCKSKDIQPQWKCVKAPRPESASKLYRPSDHRLSAKKMHETRNNAYRGGGQQNIYSKFYSLISSIKYA
jgi:hypothetical protein